MPRVAHVTPSLSRLAGGPFVSVRRLAQCLSEGGLQVDVLGTEDACTKADLPLWHPIDPLVFPRSFPYSFGYARGLRAALHAAEPDIVHSHGIWMYSSLAALSWSQKLGKPRVISPRGMLEPWALQHHAWKKRPIWWAWERHNLRTATVLHATAVEEAENLRALGLKNPIAVIANGVDLPAETAAGSGDGVRTALFLSRIHPKKGLLNLVAAWAALNPRGWRMVVAGPSECNHENEVKDAVHAAGLERQFFFPGPVYGEAKQKLYRQADLFVLPSFSENFGIVVAEALASGVPVVTTRGTPWQEIEKFRCGWWIETGVDSLAGALRRAMGLSGPELREMGMRGRRLVEENYAWPGIAKTMLAVYAWILGQGDRPECVR